MKHYKYIIREQNALRRAERKAEVTQEERIQPWEFNATHQST